MSNHTPGPWVLDNWNGRIVADNGNIVITKFDIEKVKFDDARLMTLSPQLLEALRGVMLSFECYTALRKPESEWDEYDQMVIPQWLKAKALIGSLDGET